LWVQLDQNQAAKNSESPLVESKNDTNLFSCCEVLDFEERDLERGFNIESVKDSKGNMMSYSINHTMMRN
jgi:hypothetical protein